MKEYLRLLQFIRGHIRLFILAAFLMFFSTLFEGVQFSALVPLTDIIFNKKKIIFPRELPVFLQNIVDYLNASDPKVLLSQGVFFVILLFLGKHLVTFFYGYVMNDISQKIMRDIRLKVYEKIQSLSMDYFSRKRSGELISRITHDVQVIENAVSYGITDLFRQTFTILMFITIAFSIHPTAAVIIFICFPMIGVPISKISRKLRKLSKNTQVTMADINSILLETITGIRIVKAFCNEDYEISRFKKQNQEFYKLKMKSVKRMLLMGPITEMFGLVCALVIIFWLGSQVMDDRLSFGVFALFFGSIMSIISPVKKLGNVNALTQQALAANERIYEVLDAHSTVQEKPDAATLPVLKNKITLENVRFKYDQESDEVFHGVNLEIKAGELVAIVGPTGTGKTTLVNLVSRFYDPTSGFVKFDGIDLKNVRIKSLRGQMGFVTQDTFLFNDTVKANIAYGHLQATQEEIVSAAKKAFAHRFIEKMPSGYETVVGDRGFRLSGGEKQRLAIARAILKNPPILILDEATSQLDSESERFVQEALDELMKGRTVIAIAHRLSTVRKANKIVVLEKGSIVGLGPHEQLLKTCELYKRLHDSQFQM